MSNVVSPYFEKIINKNDKIIKYNINPISIKKVNYYFPNNINKNHFFNDNYDYYISKKFIYLIDPFS